MQGVLKRINAKTLIVDFIALLSVLIIQWLTHYITTQQACLITLLYG